MARNSIIPAQNVEEEIQSYTFYSDGIVRIVCGLGETKNGVFEFFVPQQFNEYEIDGADFDALMSEKPPWAPNKPGNTFRKEDLWNVIDAKRNKTPLTPGTIIGK